MRMRNAWLGRPTTALERSGLHSIVLIKAGQSAAKYGGFAPNQEGAPRKDDLEINEALLEVIALDHGELVKTTLVADGLAAGLAAGAGRIKSTATSDTQFDHQRRRSDERCQGKIARS